MPILGVIASSTRQGLATDTGAMFPIAMAIGNGSASTITFNSIPQTYKHLQIRFIGAQSGSGETDSYIRFNSDTGSNYVFYHQLYGYNTSASASADTSTTDKAIGFYITGTNDSNVIGAGVCDILNYTSTTKNKTLRTLSGMNGTNGFIGLRSALWKPSTPAAINSISITCGSNNWSTSTQIALYGIKG